MPVALSLGSSTSSAKLQSISVSKDVYEIGDSERELRLPIQRKQARAFASTSASTS
jgi:hypothetical protein